MKTNIKLIDKCVEDFNDVIKERGTYYYKERKVKSIVKNKSIYYAKVKGSYNKNYYVKIYDNFFVNYECSCPCEFPCKHIYATLLGIDEKKYRNVYLKKNIPDINNNISMQCLLRKIPSKELKKYLIDNTFLENVNLNIDMLKSDFFKYLRKNSYLYYYNNLYNTCIINFDVKELLDKYLTELINYICIEDYQTSFNIIKATIEALFKTNYINKLARFNDLLLDLEFYLKIIYRSYNTDIIDKWSEVLEKNNYYNNIYLKNIIIDVKTK